jgi:hypothetical protein
MTESAKDAWSDVGERFTTWGRGVADRYREAGTAEGDAAEAEGELKRAAKSVVDELSRGVTALADTFKDEQAKRDLTDAVSAVGAAITATVNEATEGLKAGRGAEPTDEDPTGSDRPDQP